MGMKEAGFRISDEHQDIVVARNGMAFSINGHIVAYRKAQTKAAVLKALVDLAGPGEGNSAAYHDIIEAVWGADDTAGASFDDMKMSLHANIMMLRNDGLREAIRCHRGHGIYWSPRVNVRFGSMPNMPANFNMTRLEKSQEEKRKREEQHLRNQRREVSMALADAIPSDKFDDIYNALSGMGFLDAQIARMCGFTRQGAQHRIERMNIRRWKSE